MRHWGVSLSHTCRRINVDRIIEPCKCVFGNCNWTLESCSRVCHKMEKTTSNRLIVTLTREEKLLSLEALWCLLLFSSCFKCLSFHKIRDIFIILLCSVYCIVALASGDCLWNCSASLLRLSKLSGIRIQDLHKATNK